MNADKIKGSQRTSFLNFFNFPLTMLFSFAKIRQKEIKKSGYNKFKKLENVKFLARMIINFNE